MTGHLDLMPNQAQGASDYSRLHFTSDASTDDYSAPFVILEVRSSRCSCYS